MEMKPVGMYFNNDLVCNSDHYKSCLHSQFYLSSHFFSPKSTETVHATTPMTSSGQFSVLKLFDLSVAFVHLITLSSIHFFPQLLDPSLLVFLLLHRPFLLNMFYGVFFFF